MKTSQVSENQAVAFYRVSTQKQDNDRQFADVRQYCKAYGFNLVQEFQETISGAAKLADRKELQVLLNYVDANKPQYIICSELSRLARSQDAVTIIKGWTDKGICFISLKENIRTLNADGSVNPVTNLLLGILSAINAFELDTITYRVKSGLRKTVNRGTWIGGSVPYGFDVVDTKLVINPVEAENIRFMFQKYSEGWGSMKLAVWLNKQGFTSKQGKMWRDTTIYKILANSIYNGRRTWNGEEMETPETKIIEDYVFAAVQERLATKGNSTEINKHNKYGYLLAGKIICACGQHFKGRYRDNLYMCKSKKYGKGCNIKSIKIDFLDEELKKKLMVNGSKLLNDNSGIINQAKEMQNEVILLQEQIDAEKQTQNYLINNIAKIGQLKFDQKFDASTDLVKQLQEKMNEINIKLSHIKTKIMIPPAVAIIDPSKFEEVLNPNNKVFDSSIFSKVIIDKELVQKVIERIDIDNDKVDVLLINGNTFTIYRPKKSKLTALEAQG